MCRVKLRALREQELYVLHSLDAEYPSPKLGFTIIMTKEYPNGITIITIKVVIMG